MVNFYFYAGSEKNVESMASTVRNVELHVRQRGTATGHRTRKQLVHNHSHGRRRK